MKRRDALAVLATLLVLAACRRQEPSPQPEPRARATSDDAPSTGGTPARIVSLSPSTTEGLFAIGAGGRLVGRSRYCNWPPEVAALPQVGGFVDPNLEAILSLRPDLVVGARGPAGAKMSEDLEARGIATLFPETESLAAIDAMILALGRATGDADAAARTVAAIDARVSSIERAVATSPRVRVLLVFGLEPVSVAGPGSFADEVLRRAGGDNVVTGGGAYPTLGVERVHALDPDVIVNARMTGAEGGRTIGAGTPGWAKLRAVRDGRVVPLADETVLRPGPRIAEGLAAMARAIHPEVTLP